MSTLPELYSESESLRRVNLPSTGHWRNWLRSKIAAQSAGGALVYPKFAVDRLASQIGDLARATNPPEAQPEPQRKAAAPVPSFGTSGPIDADAKHRPRREQTALCNRRVIPAADLHTR